VSIPNRGYPWHEKMSVESTSPSDTSENAPRSRNRSPMDRLRAAIGRRRPSEEAQRGRDLERLSGVVRAETAELARDLAEAEYRSRLSELSTLADSIRSHQELLLEAAKGLNPSELRSVAQGAGQSLDELSRVVEAGPAAEKLAGLTQSLRAQAKIAESLVEAGAPQATERLLASIRADLEKTERILEGARTIERLLEDRSASDRARDLGARLKEVRSVGAQPRRVVSGAEKAILRAANPLAQAAASVVDIYPRRSPRLALESILEQSSSESMSRSLASYWSDVFDALRPTRDARQEKPRRSPMPDRRLPPRSSRG